MLDRLGPINKKQKGFTLVELLIAIAISGVIVPVLALSIAQIFMVNAASTNRMEVIKQVENVLHYVNRDGQMAWPSQTASISDSHFSTTLLTSNSGVGATTLYVGSTTGFSAHGMVVVGAGPSAESLTYSAISATSLTVAPAQKSHSQGDPVSNALLLKWTDDANATHVVTYDLVTVSGVKYLQRSETIGNEPTSTLKLARHIDSSASYYAFDGKVLTVSVTSAKSGYRPVRETRDLQVKLRPTQ